jgi:hypothetical protein
MSKSKNRNGNRRTRGKAPTTTQLTIEALEPTSGLEPLTCRLHLFNLNVF